MPRSCGAYEYHATKLQTDSRYAAARASIEGHAQEFARSFSAARVGVTTIPVVVHVLFQTADQNISDQQIASQIDVLNRDYRKRNPDVAGVPAPFQGVAADAQIEFTLADTDPQGTATNGITRTQTNVAQFSQDNAMKFTAQGGHDAWDSTKYLNIWVCKLGGGLLGYATFPGEPADTDGVVILNTAFGTTGTAAAPFNLGRTTTHEVGHWLNLHHIWGDKTNCTGDDLVADTPTQQDHNFGTPAFPHVTCNNGPNGDMFMNYMDYVDDRAMFMFTAGQVARMQAALDGPRATIGSPAFAAKIDFANQALQTTNARFQANPGMDYNSAYGGWMLSGAGSNFEAQFDLAKVPTADVTLTLCHCTSSMWPADGYAPVNIDVNNTSLKANFDPAAAHKNTGADTRNYVWDSFVIPKNALKTGTNSIKVTAQPGKTNYWIRVLQLDG